MLVAQSCLTLCDSMVCQWDSPGKNIRVGSHSLLQGIFLTQRLNLGLLHCRQILNYHLKCLNMAPIHSLSCSFYHSKGWYLLGCFIITYVVKGNILKKKTNFSSVQLRRALIVYKWDKNLQWLFGSMLKLKGFKICFLIREVLIG